MDDSRRLRQILQGLPNPKILVVGDLILDRYADAVWDTGIEFGTLSAVKRDGDGIEQQIEITTFRADSYDGVTRNPEVVYGDTLDGDLVRRDFTVNAMAVRLHPDGRHEFVDPLNGMDALLAGVLDTPAAPEQSFADDPLRMLRACRFVSQLGFTLAPRVFRAMTEMTAEIDRITAERVRAELDKTILGDYPIDGINMLFHDVLKKAHGLMGYDLKTRSGFIEPLDDRNAELLNHRRNSCSNHVCKSLARHGC
jgi:tRNA nucleotidyltransferase/poly(A) polymerase